MATLRTVNAAPTVGLTLGEVLALPSVRAGAPELLCGADQLDRVIRWAHVSELADIGPLLRGGELVLSTGIGLPDDPARLERYVAGLVAAEVGALLVELGRRFVTAPDELVAAARRAGLPLVVAHREIRFVEVTEAVHTRIIDSQVAQLRFSERLHRRFTALTVDGADVAAVVAAAAELTGVPVVLENRAHQVITVADAGVDAGPLLAGWEQRSRRYGRPGHDPARTERDPWTVVPVVARGVAWGRLVAVGPEVPDDARLVLERAAAALAVNRLSERDELALRVRAHQEVLTALAAAADADAGVAAALEARAAALGVPLHARRLIGVLVVVADHGELEPERLRRDDVERVVAAASGRFDALVDAPAPGEVRLLASLDPRTQPARVLEPFARSLHDEVGPDLAGGRLTIAVGSPVTTVREVPRSLREAAEVAAAGPAVGQAVGRRKAYLELPDVRVRGLLHVLREDPRLQDFVERELGPLLAYDADRGSDLTRTLTAYLGAGGNKTAAAAALHLSRPAFYARLAAIARVLDADLGDAETRLSLHVAVLAHAALRR